MKAESQSDLENIFAGQIVQQSTKGSRELSVPEGTLACQTQPSFGDLEQQASALPTTKPHSEQLFLNVGFS